MFYKSFARFLHVFLGLKKSDGTYTRICAV